VEEVEGGEVVVAAEGFEIPVAEDEADGVGIGGAAGGVVGGDAGGEVEGEVDGVVVAGVVVGGGVGGGEIELEVVEIGEREEKRIGGEAEVEDAELELLVVEEEAGARGAAEREGALVGLVGVPSEDGAVGSGEAEATHGDLMVRCGAAIILSA
jgi:hypothetical protein